MQNMQLEIPDVQHLSSDHHGECAVNVSKKNDRRFVDFFPFIRKVLWIDLSLFFSDAFFDRLMLFALSTIILGVY